MYVAVLDVEELEKNSRLLEAHQAFRRSTVVLLVWHENTDHGRVNHGLNVDP